MAKTHQEFGRRGGATARFATLTDALKVHPWAMEGDRLIGHLWTLGDERFAQINADDAFEGTLEEALALPWGSQDDRAPFHNAMMAILDSVSSNLEAARTRQRARDLEERLAPGTSTDEATAFPRARARM